MLYEAIDNTVELPVIGPDGVWTGQIQAVQNTAFPMLFPKDMALVIDWSIGRPKNERPKVEELLRPITVQKDDIVTRNGHKLVSGGTVVHGNWAWGSAAKEYRTFGLVRDIGFQSGMFYNAQDGLRFGRWVLPNALYGAVFGELKIGIMKPGQMLKGVGPVEDGFGYVSRSLVEEANKTRKARNLASPELARDSGQLTQLIPWTAKVEAEVRPLIEARILDMAQHGLDRDLNRGKAYDLMKELVDLDPMMIEHAFVANALSRGEKERAIRVATTIPMGLRTRVAVPTSNKEVALPAGHWALARYPVDSYAAFKGIDITKPDQAEIDRIGNMEVVQHTISTTGFNAKGQFGVVDDSLMQGYDAIICSEDIKMYARDSVKAARELRSIVLTDAYLGLTLHYVAGVSCGVSHEYFERMGGDHDGDYVFVADMGDKPEVFAEVMKFPVAEKHKLPKLDSKLTPANDPRARLLSDSMSNLIGMATNLRADTFVVSDRAFLSRSLGLTSAEALDNKIGNWLQIGQDIFKVDLAKLRTSRDELEKDMKRLQTAITRLTGGSAVWNTWGRDDNAFVHMVPQIWEPSIGRNKGDPAYELSVPPQWDGTIAQICKITLKPLEALVTAGYAARPLMEFYDWAGEVTEDELKQADELQFWFNSMVTKVNFGWDEAVNQFNTDWAYRIDEWLKTGIDRRRAAWALWRVAHQARSINAGASSVFYAFPDESKEIIKHKPGLKTVLKKNLKTIVLGVNPLIKNHKGKASVDEYQEKRGNKMVTLRRLIFEDKRIMKQQWCAIPYDQKQPPVGLYDVEIKQLTTGRWEAVMRQVA